MHYVVAKPNETIPPIHKYHPNNTQIPPKYTKKIQNCSKMVKRAQNSPNDGPKWSKMFSQINRIS